METNKQMAGYKSHACVLRVTENGQPKVSYSTMDNEMVNFGIHPVGLFYWSDLSPIGQLIAILDREIDNWRYSSISYSNVDFNKRVDTDHGPGIT